MHQIVIATIASLVFAAPALAHVTLERQEAPIGTSYKAVLKVPHGCGASPTLKLRVRIPDGVVGVKPMPKPGWQIDVVKGTYDKSYAMFHNTVTEGVREIAWTGRLADDNYDEFVFSAYLTDDLGAGNTLYFPVVQECESGIHRWIEIPAAGQDARSLSSPAPRLHLVGAAAKPAATFKSGDLVIEAPWIRATPKGAQVAGGYMKITNTGKEADRLVGGTLDQTRRFEVHQMTMVGDVMQMRPLPDGLIIKPGETVELKPGGYHVMGLELQAPFASGQTTKGTLQFEKAGTVQIEYAVAPIGGSPQAGSQH